MWHKFLLSFSLFALRVLFLSPCYFVAKQPIDAMIRYYRKFHHYFPPFGYSRIVDTRLPGMLVKVKTLTGKEVELDIETRDKVLKIKERIEEKEGIPPAQQRLIFGGKQMNDDKVVTEYNIEGGSVLHLVVALRGGANK